MNTIYFKGRELGPSATCTLWKMNAIYFKLEGMGLLCPHSPHLPPPLPSATVNCGLGKRAFRGEYETCSEGYEIHVVLRFMHVHVCVFICVFTSICKGV